MADMYKCRPPCQQPDKLLRMPGCFLPNAAPQRGMGCLQLVLALPLAQHIWKVCLLDQLKVRAQGLGQCLLAPAVAAAITFDY